MEAIPIIPPATAPTFDTTAVAGTDFFNQGLRVTAAGNVRAAVTGSQQSPGQGGLTFTPTGQVIILNVAAGALPALTRVLNGMPVTNIGELVVGSGPAVVFVQGLPFNAAGALVAAVI